MNMSARYRAFRLAGRVPGIVASLGLLSGLPALAALHPGDKVAVTVFNHPELSVTSTIDSAGNVSLPLAGTVAAQNVRPAELAARVQSRLAPFVRKPAVVVALQEQSDSIFVAGGPGGVLHYRPGETLTSALDELQAPITGPGAATSSPPPVNGYDTQAQAARNPQINLEDGPVDYRTVKIMREERQLGPFNMVSLRDSGNPGPTLQPDDTIQLNNKPVAVRVTGDVARPGTAFLYLTDPLSRAIDQVGGLNQTATQTKMSLQQPGSDPQTVSLGSAPFSQPAQNGDQIVVPRAPRVDVLGIVKKPGETLLRGSETLVSSIYYAGGPDQYANLRAVQVTHAGVKTQYDLYKLSKGADGQNPVLADGDLVFVPQGSTFNISSVWQAIGSLGFFLRF